jgi:hypothetical protein
MLNKISLRFHKKIHKGFANPIKGGQSDSGNHNRIKKSSRFFQFRLHKIIFYAICFYNNQAEDPP